MSALEQLGAFVASHAADGDTRAAARLHVADTSEGRALLAFRQPGASLLDQVAINCALARLSEIDDIHLGAMITPGAIVIPAALTIAASLPDGDSNDLVAAVVAGYEAMVRLGAAIDGPTVLYRGIWPSYFAAPFGVAAVAARLLRFDRTKTANALSTALIMAAPGTGHHAASTTARWLAAGYAASRGLQAALAAGSGFTSDLGLADGAFLKNIYGVAPDVNLLADGWDEPALRHTSFKPWCAARQTMAATQALRELIAEGMTADSIARIGVAVLPAHLKMIDHGIAAGDRFSHLTSLQYQMAVAAMAPDASYGLSGPAGAVSPALADFMARIKVRAEESLVGAGYPQNWAAHLTVTTRSRRYERTVTHVPGDPARPFGEDDLRRKFVRVVAPLLDQEQAETLFASALTALDGPAAIVGELERAIARA
jgi:2-methylcitrate dehydratase PrpD